MVEIAGIFWHSGPMMKKALTYSLILGLAAPALAQTMSAEEFDAYTQGKTFFYGSRGQPYGAEEYLPNRRVIWTFLDGQCQYGEWYEAGDLICFVYENLEDDQCWSFTRSPSGLVAQFENDPAQTELYEMSKSPGEMTCLGPGVGV